LGLLRTGRLLARGLLALLLLRRRRGGRLEQRHDRHLGRVARAPARAQHARVAAGAPREALGELAEQLRLHLPPAAPAQRPAPPRGCRSPRLRSEIIRSASRPTSRAFSCVVSISRARAATRPCCGTSTGDAPRCARTCAC